MDYFAYDSEWEEVVDLVLHEDAVFCLGEGVAVVPDFVGAGALVIDEVCFVFYLGDFCYPVHPDEWHEADFVADDLAFDHLIMRAGDDLEF